MLIGLESTLGFILKKYLDFNISSIKAEMEESKAKIQGNIDSKGNPSGKRVGN